MMKRWTPTSSLRLSRICVGIFSVLLCIVLLCTQIFLKTNRDFVLMYGCTIDDVMFPLTLTVYAVGVCAAFVLWHLSALLRNIAHEAIFVAENVRHLRALSWGCLIAGIIFATGVLYSPTLCVLAAAAAFVGLILRVVKNVFHEAVLLKTENDYTI